MTIGMSSGGTNYGAQITFPALSIPNGKVISVTLHVSWNNDAAGEGWRAAGTHKATVGGNTYTYAVSGVADSRDVPLTSGWSETSPFVVDLHSYSTADGTSKGYIKDSVYLIVTYYTFAGAPTSAVISPEAYENGVTLTWGAATPGTDNAITGYHVYYWINGEQHGPLQFQSGTTSTTLVTSTYDRYASLYFIVYAITQYNDNPGRQSNTVHKNRAPKVPTIRSLPKAVYVPGETISVGFTSNGDDDNNLKGFSVAIGTSESPAKSVDSANATSIEVDTTGWTPGVSYSFRVRAYDTLGACSDWSLPVSALVGLPMKAALTSDGAVKQVAQMKVALTQGNDFKTVKGMKVALTQGGDFKKVF
jgi:hypothetical protein